MSSLRRNGVALTGIGTGVVAAVLGTWLLLQWRTAVQDASDRAT